MVQAIANAGAVVMDKVLVHRSPTTSNVTAIGVLPVPLFAVLLGGVRAHVFAHATFKIAVELGARRLRHFVSLRSLPAAARVIDYIRSPLRQHRSESVRGR